MAITISVCMIVKNEEDVLERCLNCAKEIADEIVILDTGSTDRTKQIAQTFTDHVYDFVWIDDFAAARNASFAKATMEYCMWLDADDVIDPQEIRALQELKQNLDPTVDVVMMKYHTGFDESGRPTFSYYRERLLKRARQFQWQGAVHEVITPSGKIIYSEIGISHRKLHPSDPDRNLRIFEKQIAEGKSLDARQQFYYGRELYYHARYADAIAVFRQFLDSGAGWIENCVDACKIMAYCYHEQNEDQAALLSLFESFVYDRPRAEICCEIGKLFCNQKRYREAIFWYETASSCSKEERTGGFIENDCYDFIPYLQLCVCYDHLGDHQKAAEYNEKAGAIKPQNASYLYNKTYFEKLKQ